MHQVGALTVLGRRYYILGGAKTSYTWLWHNQLGSLHCLGMPNSGDLQRELRALVLFPEDYWSHHCGFGSLDLWLVVRMRDVELSD